jgi:hypothetical protein
MLLVQYDRCFAKWWSVEPRMLMALTKSQQKAIATAARLKAISQRFKEFSKLVGYRSVSDRLNALAVKYQEQARRVEERAGLR